MNGAPNDADRLLRWYPSAWRDRYGDELVALLEDELDGAAPGIRLRLSLASSGIRQRARTSGLAGSSADAALRLRSGALVVLVGWAILLIGGAAFAKSSEHFSFAEPPSAQALARGAYSAVAALALVCGILVLAGMALAVPATVRHLRGGGWPVVRRRVVVATAAVIGTGLVTVGLSAWAHHLDVHARNGGDAAYAAAFLAWGVLTAVTLGLVLAAGVALARRISLTRAVLRVEGALAVAVAVLVAAVTAATGLWWAAMARGAPWFLAGTRPGTKPSPVTVQLVLIEGCLVLATLVAGYGAVRTARAELAV
jgi:hypothetical protein